MRSPSTFGRGTPIGATELPPAPPPAVDVALKPSRVRLLGFGLLGAIAASGVAVAIALLFAGPDIPAEANASTPQPTAPDRFMAVGELRVERDGKWTGDPDTWTVSVTWLPVEGASGYVVSRDGRRLGKIEGTEFLDEAVAPENRYRYEVVAVGSDRAPSRPSRTHFRTEALPDAFARVQGRWVLALKVQSSSIFDSGGRILVTFTPNCERGPCPVGWAFEEAANTGTARNDGARYDGSGVGGFLTLDCHGGTVSSTVTMEFRIRKAHTVRDAWRATEISGTLTESVPSSSTCLSARNVWTFTGTAQG
jgi:hypothetical protein